MSNYKFHAENEFRAAGWTKPEKPEYVFRPSEEFPSEELA